MNLLSFFRPGKDGRAIPVDPALAPPEYYGLIKWPDPIASAASTMGKRAAYVRHERTRATVAATCQAMRMAGHGPRRDPAVIEAEIERALAKRKFARGKDVT